MPFFKGKENMGLEASLKLLDLSTDATIDDANHAYTYLHQMVDLFHQDAGADGRGSRQEDMDLLTCAYEKAVAFISDHDPQTPATDVLQSPAKDSPEATDLHFTINFSGESEAVSARGKDSRLPEPNAQTVEDAIAITARRMQQSEASLPLVHDAVESAKAASEAARRRHTYAKHARMDAIVAAKSAKSRALLLEIEAKRAMDEAIAIAQKARDRVVAARQAASDAKIEADKARKAVGRIEKSEETAAAELVCADDRLEKEKERLKASTHNLLQTRNRMKLFQGASAQTGSVMFPAAPVSFEEPIDGQADDRQQILSDLIEIEASIKSRKQDPREVETKANATPGTVDPGIERRQHDRLAYPPGAAPGFCIGGRTIPLIDLSTTGLRLEPDEAMGKLGIVRGAIAFDDQRPVQVTGRVVRQDDCGLGIKLVTRIGNHILDRERQRMTA